MTYREKYFELIKSNNKFLNKTAIKSILMDDGNFEDFSNLIRHFDDEIKNPGKWLIKSIECLKANRFNMF